MWFAPLVKRFEYVRTNRIPLALRCGVRSLYCTHHEPTRSDDELEAVFADVMARHASQLGGLQVFLAYEGLEVNL